MERLTNRNKEIPLPNSENAIFWARVHEKLAIYEDEEEQGKLVALPCKVGDHVFLTHRGIVEELEIGNITCNVFYTKNVENGFRDVDIYPNDFGRYVFQTREEAEKALEAKNG